MGLRHAVITMVNRDDLPDGGVAILARTVELVRQRNPGTTIEVLSSDLMGREEDIATLVASAPEILSHNLETVRRLTPQVRSRSTYDRSLGFLGLGVRLAREAGVDVVVKSSIMLGLGETEEEIATTVDDLVAQGVLMMNMGQYLQPSRLHAPAQKYYHPDEFAALRAMALDHGMKFVEAGPLVRSSYHASGQYKEFRELNHPLFRHGT
jgi:lipoic acid synthetase